MRALSHHPRFDGPPHEAAHPPTHSGMRTPARYLPRGRYILSACSRTSRLVNTWYLIDICTALLVLLHERHPMRMSFHAPCKSISSTASTLVSSLALSLLPPPHEALPALFTLLVCGAAAGCAGASGIGTSEKSSWPMALIVNVSGTFGQIGISRCRRNLW